MLANIKIKGFTLLEILIALLVFTIISAIVVSSLHNILNIESASEKKAARLAELQIALLTLSQDFEQAINRSVINAEGNTDGFLGYDNRVSFTRGGIPNPLGQLQRSTLQRIQYQLKNTILERLTWRVLDQVNQSRPIEKHLLTDVQAITFEYLDNEGHLQKVWPPLNHPKAVLPLAVRITLTLSDWGKISQLYIIAGQPVEKTPIETIQTEKTT